MRPIQEIYNQLRWDSRFAAGSYRLGVQTRAGPVQELPVLAFQPDGDVPWHRIVYVRGPAGLVWDRRTGLEELRPPEAAAGWGERLEVLTWNVAAGKHGLPLAERLPAILDKLQPLTADLVALQEVGPELLGNLPAHPHRFDAGELVLYCRRPPERLRQIELSPGKAALVTDFPELLVAVVHLTSDYRAEQAHLRQQQWEVLARYLEGRPWIVLGDFNDRDTLRHAGRDCTPAGPSFRPAQNRWAGQNSRRGQSARFQRILTSGWKPLQSQVDTSVQASDHDPILALLERCPVGQTGVRQALAVLPPRRLWEPLQSIRRERDPAYLRWMPHLNLVYPGPVELDRERLRQVLSEQPRFRCRLLTVDTFQHRQSETAYWKPDPASNAIFERLHRALAEPARQPFQAHLTFAKAQRFQTEELQSWARRLGEAEFEVSSLVYLRRDEHGPFQVADAFPLAPARHLPADWPRPLLTVGSRLLGGGGDLDLVHPGLEPESEQSALLERWPEARAVGRVVRGPGVDLAFARIDPEDEHWRAVLDWEALFAQIQRRSDLETFQADFAGLSAWLEERGLKGQSWGWPGGLAWAVLLDRWEGSDFWERGSREPWATPLFVGSPAFPARNLTEHVPGYLVRELACEFRHPRPARGLCLKLEPAPERPGLPFLLDMRRRYGFELRPYSRAQDCCIPVPAQAAETLLRRAREHFGEASLVSLPGEPCPDLP